MAVHTGHATVGPLGSEYHEEYTAVGVTVAEAEGLLDRARGGRLLLSGRVHGHVCDRFAAALVDNDERLGGVYELERSR
jgi:class 3 adenylate cyclase